MKIKKLLLAMSLLGTIFSFSSVTFANTQALVQEQSVEQEEGNVSDISISIEESTEPVSIENENVYELVSENFLEKGDSKPTSLYDYSSKGKYSFTYSNKPINITNRYWSNYKFTNCNSTMYLKLSDESSSNTSNWYYEIYANGKSIGEYTGQPGKSYTVTISNVKSSDEIYFYIAAGSQSIKGSGSLSNSK
ncbi:MAG: hypothetical protein ACRCTE_08290 [Cellulosilyticaceae bacterium]